MIMKIKNQLVILIFGSILFSTIMVSSLTIKVNDSTPVDGDREYGFPLIFYKESSFPPNQIIDFIALISNLLVYLLVSIILTFLLLKIYQKYSNNSVIR